MKKTTRDNLIYLGVAGAIVAAVVAYVFYTDATLGTTPDIPVSILWAILATPAIVGLILEGFWKYRRRRALWAIVAAAATVNIAVSLFGYMRGWQAPVLWWSIPTGFCLIPLFVVTAKILGKERGRSQKHSGRDRSRPS